MYTDPSGHKVVCVYISNGGAYPDKKCSEWLEQSLIDLQSTDSWKNKGLDKKLDINEDITVFVYDSIPMEPKANASYWEKGDVIRLRKDLVGTVNGFGSIVHEGIHDHQCEELGLCGTSLENELEANYYAGSVIDDMGGTPHGIQKTAIRVVESEGHSLPVSYDSVERFEELLKKTYPTSSYLNYPRRLNPPPIEKNLESHLPY